MCKIKRCFKKWSQKGAEMACLMAILFMQIRLSKTQNFAWEPGLMDLSDLSYGKKCGSQLLPQNAPNMHIFQKWL